jgi:hypothetical protein
MDSSDDHSDDSSSNGSSMDLSSVTLGSSDTEDESSDSSGYDPIEHPLLAEVDKLLQEIDASDDSDPDEEVMEVVEGGGDGGGGGEVEGGEVIGGMDDAAFDALIAHADMLIGNQGNDDGNDGDDEAGAFDADATADSGVVSGLNEMGLMAADDVGMDELQQQVHQMQEAGIPVVNNLDQIALAALLAPSPSTSESDPFNESYTSYASEGGDE